MHKTFTPLPVLLAAVLSACSGGETQPAAAAPATQAMLPALTVRVTTLREETWDQSLAANGSIRPWQEAVIGAQVPGLRIAEVKAGLGDRVKQGDLLLTLGNRTSSGETYVQARVVAPDDGVISAANANVGSMVTGGMELFRLIRQGRLEWQAELMADELMRLHRGMGVEVMLPDGRTVKGTVRAISPAVDPQTRYGLALVSLQDSSGLIAGAYVRGSFAIGGAAAVQSLPQSALQQRGSQTYVLVVGADGHVQERTVEVGQRKGERIEIRQGLQAGERVVESGGAFLTGGDAVQVVQ